MPQTVSCVRGRPGSVRGGMDREGRTGPCPCGPVGSGGRNGKGEGESLRRGASCPPSPDGHVRIQASGPGLEQFLRLPAVGLGGGAGLGTAQYAGHAVAGGFGQHVGEVAEVLGRGAEDLVTHLLAGFLVVLGQMAGQALRTAGVGQQVAVQVADGAHDGAGELLLVGTEGAQVVGHLVIGGQGLVHVGIAVRGADQGAAHAVQHAEGAVGTAAHAHALPQIAHAHVTQDDAGRAVVGVAQVVEVGRLAHIVDLGRGQEGLGGGQTVAEGRQHQGRVTAGGQGGQQVGGLPLHGIQTGGLGVVTISASFTILSGKKIGLSQRSIMAESVAAPQLRGVVRLTGFIVRVTLGIELIGALLMAPVFCRDFGLFRGLWMSLFHSVSAFCNAGIDLLGVRGAYSSLTSYAYDPLINLVIILLIVIGGIGFLTWDDIYRNRHHISRYRMQSKVILSYSLALIFIPAILFFFLEFQDIPAGKRILVSLFQSVTTRTAGFNTADLSSMRESGQFLMILLMLVGGSPGSTAGGIKTTTLAVLISCATAVFARKDSPEMFKRRIIPDIVATAIAIFFMYTSLGILCAMTLSILESLPLIPCLFEAISALATVGLSFGITPTLSVPSKLILITFMFIGRVGGLTIIYATMSGYKIQCGKFPQEKISVG